MTCCECGKELTAPDADTDELAKDLFETHLKRFCSDECVFTAFEKMCDEQDKIKTVYDYFNQLTTENYTGMIQ